MIASIVGAAAVESMLDRQEQRTLTAVAEGLEATCIKGTAQVKAAASGSPGPDIRTGDYVGSIEYHMRISKTAAEGWIGTNRPQGARLELGFVGVDRLGRHYNQAPRPHFGPVAQTLPQDLRTEIESRLGRSI